MAGTLIRRSPGPEATTDDVPQTTADTATARGPTVSRLTLGEVAGLGAVLFVACVGAVSLGLAEMGRHDGWRAMGLGVVLAVSLGVLAVGLWGRPAIEVDKTELLLVGATLVGAAFFFLPGFPYAYGDKDPGVYVAHGFAIARDGDVAIPDEVEQAGLDTPEYWGGDFPGVWPAYDRTDAVTSQFFHFDSALMATAHDVAGRRGVFNMTPLLAILGVGLIVLAVRRTVGTPAAAITGALLVTSMMQVWQAKYPSTEIPAQLFLAGALLGAVLAIERGWAGGAFVTGLLVGVGFMTRPDGFLYVILAAAVAGLVIALGRADRRLVALGLGLAIMLPGALWNAYELRLPYSEANDVPGLPTLVTACAALLGAGWGVHAIEARRGDLLALVNRWRVPLGAAFTVLMGVVLLVLWNRRTLFGPSEMYNTFSERWETNLNEENPRWLALFVTLPGLAVMWLGIVVTALRRVKPALYVLLLPGLLLLPLYLWHARVSMRLMWWVRRFIPAVLPAILILIALALAWALWHRFKPLRLVGAAGAVALVVAFASMSLPLRHHDEMDGSWAIAEQIADQAGDEQGLFLFTASTSIYDAMRNSPTAVWWIFDQTAAKLPDEYDIDTIDAYSSAFRGRPVFLVLRDQLPDTLPADRFELADIVVHDLVFWEEWPMGQPGEDEKPHRPDHDEKLVQALMIWRVLP